MKLVNLTPHAVTLHGDGLLVLPPSGTVARLAVTREPRPDISVAPGDYPGLVSPVVLPVVRPSLGAVTELPDAREGVVYVVSALVAEAVKRPDVLSPGELIRDGTGVIIGARGLCSYI